MSETMRAVIITEPGGPEVLEVRSVPRPEPGPGDLLVRVSTSGVNRADLLQTRGSYPAPEGFPQEIPGLEYAGTVEAVGAGVRDWGPGDAAMGITGGGAYAEYVRVAAATAVPVPEGVAVDAAGAIPEVFFTAWDALVLQCALSAGETLLVHAVGSGVGTAAVQLARDLGARVLGTSRTPEKLERAVGLGLDHPVPGDASWPARVMEITEGRGADVILDLVGGPYLAGNQSVLATLGRQVVVGVSGGARAEIDLRALMGRRGAIRGTVLRARPAAEKAALAARFAREVVPRFAAGTLTPVVDRVFPAAEAAEAHRLVASNRTFGKVLLEW
jgi:NADPH2:quinone reductase